MRMLLVYSMVILVSCMPVPFSSPYIPKIHRDYFDLPLQERRSIFPTYPIEKQYQIYIEGTKTHHPDGWHPYVIAERGSSAAPFLLDKHKSTDNMNEKFAITRVFEIMEKKGYYYPSKEEERIIQMLSEPITK